MHSWPWPAQHLDALNEGFSLEDAQKAIHSIDPDLKLLKNPALSGRLRHKPGNHLSIRVQAFLMAILDHSPNEKSRNYVAGNIILASKENGELQTLASTWFIGLILPSTYSFSRDRQRIDLKPSQGAVNSGFHV